MWQVVSDTLSSKRLQPADARPLPEAEASSHVARDQDRARSTDLGILLITHYTRILRYIQPDFVHVFFDGRIVESGGPELADQLESEGYARFGVNETASA